MTSTPQQRIESGVYDASVDFAITDDMRQRADEAQANALVDIRGFIDNQIDTLCGDDLDNHFALQAVLGGMIKLGRQQT